MQTTAIPAAADRAARACAIERVRTIARTAGGAILRTAGGLALIAIIGATPSPVTAQAGDAVLPARAELADGWTTLRPAGETSCARGGEYVFHVRTGDPQRLLVFLYGGGACWDADGCARDGGRYVHTLEPTSHPAWLGGIFDFTEPMNPFADYDVVAVPYCTGDVFLGDRDTVYRVRGSDDASGDAAAGAAREFTIRHRGQTNTLAVLAWVQANYRAPARIVVAGSSAGSAGVPLYAHRLARHYPDAQVVGIGDDAGSYGVATRSVDLAVWGLPETLQRHQGWEGYERGLRVDATYVMAGRGTPNLRLFQIDHAWDNVQRGFVELAGTPDPELPSLIRANREAIRRELPDFRAVLLGGFAHTTLVGPTFYRYRVGEGSLRDWVAAAAAGSDVPDVECDDPCHRAVLAHDDEGLAVVDRAIALLSTPGAWNARDPGGRCPADAESWSLRCAVSRAIRDVTGRPPVSHPGGIEVLFEAAERTGWPHANAVIRFNNQQDATAADMLALLETVRQRILASPRVP